MNVIICVDNKMGIMFNGRRQSRDIILCSKVVSLVGENKLFLKSYSYELFKDFNLNTIQSADYLSMAENGDFCFVEGESVKEYNSKIEKLYLFKWNRDYPSDVKLDIDPLQGRTMIHTEDFEGNSHEKITLEIYERV